MKTTNKIMTNEEIYSLALGMSNNFNDNEIYMPAVIAYSIQKNKKVLLEIAEEIELTRMNIIQHYGEIQENGQYLVSKENIDKANKELEELLSIQQEIKIYLCPIEAFDDIKFTSIQMGAIMFMIDED